MNSDPPLTSPASAATEPPPLPAPVSVSPAPATTRFRYEAQAADGMRMDGSVEAASLDNAMARLAAMGLNVLQIRPGDAEGIDSSGEVKAAAKSGRSLTPGDFAAFNEQLAQLASAGLPLEHGLRLIADDMRRGRLATAIREVAGELERGVPLGEAFDKHRGRFPSLYGRVIEAGVRGGDLGAVLIGVGRHQELVQRLRNVLWRTLAYPLMVFVALAMVLVFLGLFVMPRFQEIFTDFRMELPFPTRVVLALGPAAPYIGIIILFLVIAIPLLWAYLKLKGRDRAATDRWLVPLPIIGSVFRLSLIARWCDALRIGVSAGLDLPAAIDLATDAVGSRRLRDDGNELKSAIEAGRPLEGAKRRILPATIASAIEMSAGRNSLPQTLESLSQTYRRQAESRIAAVPTLVTPLGLILIALSIGFIVLALFLPLIQILQGVSGISKK